MTTNAQTKGRARIAISDRVIERLPITVEKPKAGRVAWDWMEVEELAGTFQEVVLLPEDYTIVGVFFDIARYTWLLIVESAAIPIPDEGAMIPMMIPKYERATDGRVRLVALELEK